MKISEILEYRGDSDYTWNLEKQEPRKEQLYVLLNQNGKIVRTGITMAAVAMALKSPHFIKKYGKMSYRKQ
jgi:hypothetical protein